jgi:hypothetical protein
MAKAAVSCPNLSCLTLSCPHEVRYAFFPIDAASLSRLLSDLEDGLTWSTETQIDLHPTTGRYIPEMATFISSVLFI